MSTHPAFSSGQPCYESHHLWPLSTNDEQIEQSSAMLCRAELYISANMTYIGQLLEHGA